MASAAINKELNEIINEEYNIEFELELKVVKEIALNQKCLRHASEIKIFFILRDYINLLNVQTSNIPTITLKIVAFTYKKRTSFFEIIIYSADKWDENFVTGIAKLIEEYWIQEVKEEVKVQLSHIEIVNQKLYITDFLIPSEHMKTEQMQFFYNNL